MTIISVDPIRDLETIKAIRKVLKKQSLRNEFLFIFGINVGLRIGDILKIRVQDICLNNESIKEYVKIKEQKTGKHKRFYLGGIVKETAQIYINQTAPAMEDFLFKSRKGKNQPISRTQAYRILNNAAFSIGLVQRNENGNIIYGEIGTHTLRKTFGYHAYKNGVDIVLLQDILNHSSPSTTLKYIGFTEEQKQAVYLNSNLG
ncbi:site-specific integrase [Salipaludibacillus sp. HK11]|uniref:site-specific integrase n=1 Tax=Salipaludibacillus sp. HK11 TaxID=3394320 RepID=UPI0039FD0824